MRNLAKILCCLSLLGLPSLNSAKAGNPTTYTTNAVPYAGTELWYCDRGGLDRSCSPNGILTSGLPATFTGIIDNASTAHFVPIAEGASLFTYATPTATLGAALVSKGLGADPAFLSPANSATAINTNIPSTASTVTFTQAGFSQAGHGGAAIITPVRSGNVLVVWTLVSNSTVSPDGCTFQTSHGTGTPPVVNAAATGTVSPPQITMNSAVAAINSVTAFATIVTGLTLGTAYWFDLQLEAAGGGTCTAANGEAALLEF